MLNLHVTSTTVMLLEAFKLCIKYIVQIIGPVRVYDKYIESNTNFSVKLIKDYSQQEVKAGICQQFNCKYNLKFKEILRTNNDCKSRFYP